MRYLAAGFLDDEIAEKERDAVVPGTGAVRPQIDPRDRVGEALVPSCQRGVVVALVVHVPAEDHVAKAEAAVDGGEEFILVDVLAAQHAVDVGYGDLDAGPGGVADRVEY